MKYIVILGDGMADKDIPELGNKTILDVAKKPHIDSLKGVLGMARTVPKELKPGSDVANLAVMGFSSNLSIFGTDTVFTLFAGENPFLSEWGTLILLLLILFTISRLLKLLRS